MARANSKKIDSEPTREHEVFGFDPLGADVNIPLGTILDLISRGQGTGQKVALWAGSGDSKTLTNAPISVTGDDVEFDGIVTINKRLELNDEWNNTFIGKDSGLSNTSGNDNASLGHRNLEKNTTGGINVAIGSDSLRNNTTGQSNISLGYENLYTNTLGGGNTSLGYRGLYSNTLGDGNIAIGSFSLDSNTIGNNNIALGLGSGRYIAEGSAANATGSNSIFIGKETRANTDGQTNQIVIGDSAIGKGSNTVTLGNDSITDTFLKGDVKINIDNKLFLSDYGYIRTQSEVFGEVKQANSLVYVSQGSNHYFLNDNGDLADTSAYNVTATQYKVSALNTAPESATAVGTTGEIRYTEDYIYVCTATNTWKRTALTTW
tara:strand:+ start:371 stop:1501 length:1131 start_codon:yes stop_codon:yes gene_type:complete